MTTTVIAPDQWDAQACLDDGVTSLVLCDFDDVLNFFPRGCGKELETLHPNRKKFRQRVLYDNYKINYDLDVLSSLNDIASHPSVQWVWLTTWRGHIVPVSQRIGLVTARPQVVLKYGFTDRHNFDKQDAVQQLLSKLDPDLNDDLRFVWIDDRATPTDEERDAVLGRFADHFLLVAPPDSIGLVADDIPPIKEFLNL